MTAQGTRDSIVPTVWDDEGLVYLARPDEVHRAQSKPLIEIANYAISVEIHPKGDKITLESGQGIKVLYGSVTDNNTIRKALNVDPFPEIVPVTSEDTVLRADSEHGAIILRMVPIGQPGEWPTAQDVPVKTTLDTNMFGIQFPPLQFKKVDTLWWGSNFKGVDFYNLSGFSFRFQDDKTQIAHMQFWTAGMVPTSIRGGISKHRLANCPKGTNVDCGVHNHSGDIFQEIHICLSPGTKNGGMSRLMDDGYDDGENSFEHVPIPRLYEHGGLWYRDSNGVAIRGKNNVVSYPWHKWQAGSGPNVDVWMALEFNPDLKL